MVDKVGVCSICARVCHKGHDVTYAKYGNFFCDCGAKSSSSCLVINLSPSSELNLGSFDSMSIWLIVGRFFPAHQALFLLDN